MAEGNGNKGDTALPSKKKNNQYKSARTILPSDLKLLLLLYRWFIFRKDYNHKQFPSSLFYASSIRTHRHTNSQVELVEVEEEKYEAAQKETIFHIDDEQNTYRYGIRRGGWKKEVSMMTKFSLNI